MGRLLLLPENAGDATSPPDGYVKIIIDYSGDSPVIYLIDSEGNQTAVGGGAGGLPAFGPGVGSYDSQDAGRVFQVQPTADGYKAVWTDIPLPILARAEGDSGSDGYAESLPRSGYMLAFDFSESEAAVKWQHPRVEYSYVDVSTGVTIMAGREVLLQHDGDPGKALSLRARVNNDSPEADEDHDENEPFPVTAKNIVFGGSHTTIGEGTTGQQTLSMAFTGDITVGGGTVAVPAAVAWCRNGFAVSISGRADITAASAGAGEIAIKEGANEAFDYMLGNELGSSGFGVVVVEDRDSESPTYGQVIAHGFIDYGIQFTVPAAGDYRIHFSGHLSLLARPFVPGA